MSGLAEMLTELAGGGGNMRDIEHELALAQRAASHTHRGHINWARHFPWLKRRLGELQNHRCCWCGKLMAEDGPRDDRPTFEHIVPLSTSISCRYPKVVRTRQRTWQSPVMAAISSAAMASSRRHRFGRHYRSCAR